MRETINLRGSEDERIPEAAHVAHQPRRSKKYVAPVIVIVALFLGWWFVNSQIQWKAVFLTNNQVYFGHFLEVPFMGSIDLHNVYYLQFSQAGQQLDANTQDQSQLKLVKLGSEVHGPTDEMTIPMTQVLFWETLRSDSAIVTTIKNGKNQTTP